MFPIPPHFYRMYFANSCLFTYIIDWVTWEAFSCFYLENKTLYFGVFQSSLESHVSSLPFRPYLKLTPRDKDHVMSSNGDIMNKTSGYSFNVGIMNK
jgi:hypothetical protein